MTIRKGFIERAELPRLGELAHTVDMTVADARRLIDDLEDADLLDVLDLAQGECSSDTGCSYVVLRIAG